ncbi:PsiF family protein [Methylocystis heyeri]|uniref:Phosphate starvation-inducible protein PsiF n=1 Tax=Methylocystis heyeri TaxID=391905 RepID=A0A6B8KAU4_9HYPH|nr:PsiF family protein [Methylocystis heyeri]QGM44622.1 phosphate starvation-inducible protein PsiF [Methylocystis heyeri]
MRFKTAFTALIVTGLLGLNGAMAQTAAPASPGGAEQSAAPMDKKAISKDCSAQADAKGLHGRARHKFRSECRKAGGKM